jgi:membrane protein DedA with SNARE-associated domain
MTTDRPEDSATAASGAATPGKKGATAAPPADWREVLPWEGKASFTDKALMWAIAGVMVLLLALLPFRPYMIASSPVVLEFLTGSKAAIGAAAAFARIGEIPLWLVVFAGTVGMAKFDFLFWWTGRQWGHRIVRLFAPGDKAQRFAEWAQRSNPWLIRAAVLCAGLPGIPSALVYALAGTMGMRLVTFLVLNLLGSAAITGLVAGLGYGLGQHAVDVVLLIDEYALWVSLAIIFVIAMTPTFKAVRASQREEKERKRRAAHTAGSGEQDGADSAESGDGGAPDSGAGTGPAADAAVPAGSPGPSTGTAGTAGAGDTRGPGD